MPHQVIIIPEVNAQKEICDHTDQTAKVLSAIHTVYIFYCHLPPKNIFHFIKGQDVFVAKILPFNRFRFVYKLNSFLTFNLFYLITVIRHRQFPLFWIFYPQLFNLVRFSLPPKKMIFDILDGFISAPTQNKYFLQHSDFVLVMSPTLQGYYQHHYGHANYILTHPASTLTASTSTSTTPHKNIIGYIGGINERLDFTLLYKVIKATPQLTYLFAGPINHDNNVAKKPVLKLFDKILTLPNTKYLGLIPKNQISTFLNQITIGIIPYDSTELFNQLSFPLKAIEYLLASKPVLSTPLPELKNRPNLFNIASTPHEWVKKLSQPLKTPSISPSQFSWSDKLSPILKQL